MLLPEAKKVNKELLKELDIPEREKERVAVQIGIGAIDRLQNLRKGFDIPHVTLLPGETEE